MKPFYLSKSLLPYLIIAAGSLLLFAFGFAFNSGGIGSLFGGMAARIDIRYNLYFVLGILLIYSIRRPYLAIAAAVLFATLYQIYVSEFSEVWQMRGLEKPSYYNFSRIYAGVLMLSCIGLCHFIIQKIRTKVLPDTALKSEHS